MWRIVDIDGDGFRLNIETNKLIVRKDVNILEEVALNDISLITMHSNNATVSLGVLRACAEQNIPLIVCDSKHTPSGMLLSLSGNREFGKRQSVQIETRNSKKAAIWTDIVVKKISNQERLLRKFGFDNEANVLRTHAEQVEDGDRTNREAAAAGKYFKTLFSGSFSRDNDLLIENALLNYGYSILRSTFCRIIVETGLNPSLSVFHSNQINMFALADDLMEPLRPVVDLEVYRITKTNEYNRLSTEVKKRLIAITKTPFLIGGKKELLLNAIKIYVQGYFNHISGKRDTLDFPFPLELQK